MRIDIMTLFPEMCSSVMRESIIGRAQKNGLIDIRLHNIRDYAYNKHKRVDDTTYGGGMGMLMMAEPIACCFESIYENMPQKPKLIYMTPRGKLLNQDMVKELSKCNNIAILCGHYEGVDERVIEEYVDEQISIGDYVLTGGELPALVLADAIIRLLPGVLSNNECFEDESHYNGLLEYPQYTKPSVWRDKKVPDILLSGHHENIKKWRRVQSLILTNTYRPDLIEKLELSSEEKTLFHF